MNSKTVNIYFMKTADKTFSLDDLCMLTDLPKRTVRFYMQSGLLERPVGSKRGAYYEQRHLEQLIEIKKWQAAGLNLDRIRELVSGNDTAPVPPPIPRQRGGVEVWSHIAIGAGIELMIEPKQAQMSAEQVRELTKAIMQAYEKINQKENV